MAQLIAELFHEALDNEWLRRGNDQAAFDVEAGKLVMTTDAYVISPIFFPGGDIGSLSVHGTVNDIAMAGARPRYLSASFILEEGFPLAQLRRVAESMGAAARAAGVGLRLEEEAIPVKPAVTAACELLGLDPLYVANEGKLVAFVAPRSAAAVLAAMRDHPLGREAAIIGEAVADEHRFVQMTTGFGGERMVDWLAGEQLPRIC